MFLALMSAFVPAGPAGVAVIISGLVVITGLALTTVIAAAVLAAWVLGRRQDRAVLDDAGPQQDRQVIHP